MSERDKRYPTKYPVVLRKGPEMFAATLCNISQGGGCVLGAPAVKKGDTFVLDYGSGQTRATAMWTMARMTGLKFENRLSREGLNSIRVLTAPA
ncbi:PilZ domain-containing protein [Octadecabacter sp. CECT 8868]|uniref:PilZ domain-containing protein n=1 Tax=Octadecabacter algicola TaxID=2909342 RepID=UPI001F18271E|nr:PilZ domain-containing protein [Octadecabacter algicola]MCF2904502.1 PilZ domain-containing protein [Octadecabacter algicola]